MIFWKAEVSYRCPTPVRQIIGILKDEIVSPTQTPLQVRVYWEDTDAGGVLFYANYLKIFERARTEWLSALGVSQSTLQAEQDCIFVVAEVNLRYLASAKLDDLLDITVRVGECGKASMLLEQQAWRGDVVLAQASVRIGCVHGTKLRPRRIPEDVRALL